MGLKRGPPIYFLRGDNIETKIIRGPKFYLARAPKFLNPALLGYDVDILAIKNFGQLFL